MRGGLWLRLPLFHLPYDLTQHAEQRRGVCRREFKAPGHATHLFLGTGRRLGVHITALSKRIAEHRREALQLSRRGWLLAARLVSAFRSWWHRARQFVETYGHGLPQVHRSLIVLSGNAEQPVAVAEVLVR